MIRDRRRPRPPLTAILALLSFLVPAAARADDAAQLAARVVEAQGLVARVRGVAFRSPVASALLPEKDLEAVLSKKLVEDLPVPFETYVATLSAIGLVDPTPDLLARLTRLYTRQVVGFYDPAEKRFYIVPERARETAGPAGDLMEKLLLTHELTHALQDQRLGLDRRMKALRDSTDALLALQAVLEGEATLLMTDALIASVPEEARQGFGNDPVDQILDGLATSSAVDGSEGVPDFFVKQLVFPYAAGTAWVRQRKREGGWAGLDAVYDRLPSTTREILRPGAPREARRLLSSRDRPGPSRIPAGMVAAYADTLGEWALGVLLERAGAGEAVRGASAAWQDDRVVFFAPRGCPAGRGIGFLWRIRTTSPEDAARLATLLAPLYSGRPAPARPSVTARGDVVEVFRPAARLPAG